MKKRMFGMLVISILMLALSGCKDSNEANLKQDSRMERWVSPDGSFTLPLDEKDWKVEKESNGELHFLNHKNEKFSFSVSKWDGLQFPEDFDYEEYYSGYVEDIRLEFPDAEETGVLMLESEEAAIVQMGVRYQVLENLCQVTTSMIAVPGSEDTLCFVAIYPAENKKEQEAEFEKIVTGIRFDLEKE